MNCADECRFAVVISAHENVNLTEYYFAAIGEALEIRNADTGNLHRNAIIS